MPYKKGITAVMKVDYAGVDVSYTKVNTKRYGLYRANKFIARTISAICIELARRNSLYPDTFPKNNIDAFLNLPDAAIQAHWCLTLVTISEGFELLSNDEYAGYTVEEENKIAAALSFFAIYFPYIRLIDTKL